MRTCSDRPPHSLHWDSAFHDGTSHHHHIQRSVSVSCHARKSRRHHIQRILSAACHADKSRRRHIHLIVSAACHADKSRCRHIQRMGVSAYHAGKSFCHTTVFASEFLLAMRTLDGKHWGSCRNDTQKKTNELFLIQIGLHDSFA